jgi:hypothetical protein
MANGGAAAAGPESDRGAGQGKYVLSYKGLAFHTRSPEPIHIPADIETVQARRIWAPD